MRALLDVNGIIALLDSAQVMHASACSWLERNLDQGWATCPLTQNSVVRIMAQPAYPNTQPAQQGPGATAGHLWLIPAHSAQGQRRHSRHRSRWSSLAKPLIGVALAMGVLTAGKAQAFVVNVGGQDWDVTTFTGSYNANSSQFATAANGGVMPWWGDSSLASQFATQVGTNLGLPNPIPNGGFFGPGFAYQTSPFVNYFQRFGNVATILNAINLSNQNAWAQATLVTPPPAPVPSPLPALGAAAAFGYSRKLRSRIKGRTNTVSSTYSL